MRNAMLAILALVAGGTAVIAGSAPAAAYDYPWCVRAGSSALPATARIRPMANARRRLPGAGTSIATSIQRVLFARQRAAQQRHAAAGASAGILNPSASLRD